MFNAQLERSELAFGQRACIVLDDALAAPNELRALAVRHWSAFSPPHANAFPGPELPLPESAAWALARAAQALAGQALGFEQHPEAIYSVFARLSVATRQAQALDPIQRLCHRDRLGAQPGASVLAAVLYLFDDARLGGTNFFEPTDPKLADARMAQAAAATHAELDAAIGPERGYLCASNAWFTHLGTVAPRFNRMAVYDGSQFHGSAIDAPSRLLANPASGRLTLNVFAVVAVSGHLPSSNGVSKRRFV